MKYLIFLITLISAPLQASEVVTLSTTVKGNQEHPSVTYIVPWQQASDTSELSMPFKTRIKDVFDHVERVEHEREVSYLRDITESNEQP
mgnify:CR=1 FL=1